MLKRALKRFISKIIIKLKFIYEENKLRIIYNNPNIVVEEGVNIEEYFSANLPADDFSIKIGSYVRIKKYCSILLLPKAELIIGSGVFLNNYCSINCLEKISIGENTMFGEGVKLYDHNHSIGRENNNLAVVKDQFETAPIYIGKNCWIGSNVTILKGVTIGDNVVIGANNLIYQSIPDNTMVKSKTDYIIETKS
jgi:acetyltransferase-like isoleucine patch superfamily enzyme